MPSKRSKLEKLASLVPIKNEEANFLCGGTIPIADLSRTTETESHSSSNDADSNSNDTDGPATSTRPGPMKADNWI